MRLLEFNHADSGAGPEQPAHMAAQNKGLPGTPAPRVHPVRKPAHRGKSTARIFPLKGKSVRTTAQNGPVDLEMLQQRLELLEKRIMIRAEKNQAAIPGAELEELKQRLLKLERNINSELWAARQREYTMLEMLAKPTLDKRISQYIPRTITRIRIHHLPASGRWLKAEACEWLQDRLPLWWPTIAKAWQESFDKARGTSHD